MLTDYKIIRVIEPCRESRINVTNGEIHGIPVISVGTAGMEKKIEKGTAEHNELLRNIKAQDMPCVVLHSDVFIRLGFDNFIRSLEPNEKIQSHLIKLSDPSCNLNCAYYGNHGRKNGKKHTINCRDMINPNDPYWHHGGSLGFSKDGKPFDKLLLSIEALSGEEQAEYFDFTTTKFKEAISNGSQTTN